MSEIDLKGRDYICELDFTQDELFAILDLARALKRKFANNEPHKLLADKTLFMIFYNQSLRTRNSFEAGMTQLGGHAHFLDPGKIYTPALEGEERAYSTERISDVARTLARYGHGIAIRMYGDPTGWVYGKANATVREFAHWADIPIINMECDKYHPCQSMADMLTVKEKLGTFERKKFVMSWAYSPSVHKPLSVPQSVVLAASMMGGLDIVLAQPEGLELDDEVVNAVKANVDRYGGSFELSYDMNEAFKGADIVYPKAWTSKDFIPPVTEKPMLEATQELFDRNKNWICDREKLKLAKPSCLYMHCLPADRGFEVTNDVIDGPRSVVFDEAENRLHVQKAIMAMTMGSAMVSNLK